jgi:D-proline reductase (dithiol) PrdB
VLTSKLEAAQANIREHWYPHFSWLINKEIPWTPPARPLGGSTVALVSTCGLYCLDSQLPFDAWNDAGDPSFREINVDTPVDRLRIAHSHYDHQQVSADLSVALPLAHFRQLVDEGAVARLHPWAYSFMGYLPESFQLINKTAPQVARRLAADGVHAAFLTPC